jgi:ribosome-associated protein
MDKKALEPVLLDLSEEDSYTDYLLIVSAKSDRQVRAIAEHVVEMLGEHGLRPLGVEGAREGRWTLVDFGDLVVHVFSHSLREFYDLEGLWVDAKHVPLEVPAELRIQPYESYDDDLGYSLAK